MVKLTVELYYFVDPFSNDELFVVFKYLCFMLKILADIIDIIYVVNTVDSIETMMLLNNEGKRESNSQIIL